MQISAITEIVSPVIVIHKKYDMLKQRGGGAMDKTKEEIIKMVNTMDNETCLNYIYTLLKTLLKNED